MRNGQQEDDGIVGEVVFPNTVPPFFPSFVLFAKPPTDDEYEHRLAGVRAHNRWLVDWCGEYPERRAGVGQIFLNDVDDAIDDVKWIKEHGLRGGILLPNIAPDVKWVKPLYDPCYDPLWEVLQDLEIPVNVHGGTGNPDYGTYPVSMLLYINEVLFYSQRPFVQMLLSGVFERFPRLKFVMTETGCAWVPPLLEQLDDDDRAASARRARPARSATATSTCCPKRRHRVLPPELLDGREPARPGRRRRPATRSASTGSCGAATTRTTRARTRTRASTCGPRFARRRPRTRCARSSPATRPKLYDFDLDDAGAARRRRSARRSTRSPPRSTQIPDKDLDRLSGDMDPQAIK